MDHDDLDALTEIAALAANAGNPQPSRELRRSARGVAHPTQEEITAAVHAYAGDTLANISLAERVELEAAADAWLRAWCRVWSYGDQPGRVPVRTCPDCGCSWAHTTVCAYCQTPLR